jgi:hypothetical protein
LEDSAPDEIILTNRRIREPYVRWCERTGSELIATFLLDVRDSIAGGLIIFCSYPILQQLIPSPER